VLLKLIQPYTRIRLPFISTALHIPEGDVEQLLVSLILDNRIEGHVDQVRGRTRVQHAWRVGGEAQPRALQLLPLSACAPRPHWVLR
jgi:hypothetical protein